MQKRSLLGAALVALFAAACGQGPDLIDRTQPNFIRKSELQAGEWYVMDTVVDVPPTSPLAFIGMQGQMDKVRFEVLEDMLVAYRSYEFVPGTDPLVDADKSRIGKTVYKDGSPYRGSPYGAWRIVSHFDRQRQYNAATGEQSNVLVEDMQDRPWYQREFIRVDWSKNLITNLTLADDTAGSMQFMTRGYFVQPIDQDPADDAFTLAYGPDATREDGSVVKGALEYMDFTVKAIAQPPTYDYPGYGPIPYCWLNPRVDCEAAELKFRYSFKRVDAARVMDYEPLVYNDKMMTKFGYFRTERITYDRNRGVTDSGRLLFADRHNLWTKWRDSEGNVIPVENRKKEELRPVVYHLSQGFPKELMPAVRNIEASWDKAFRRAVAVPLGLELNQVPQMYYLCENPVPAGAPEACGEAGTAARLGDIRFNILAWVADPMLAGPLGYGPHGADPETGEIVQAGAYIYGAGIDSWSGDAQQVMELLTGDLSMNDLLAGKNVRDFVSRNFSATDPRRPSGPATAPAPLTAQQRTPESFRNAQPQLRGMVDSWMRAGHPPVALQDRRAVVDQLIASNPALSSEMVDNPEVRAAVMAAAPGEAARTRLATDESFYRTVARQTMLRLKDLESLERERVDRASRGNIWLAEFSDDQFLGLAKDLSAKFKKKVTELQAGGKSLEAAQADARDWAWNEMRNAALRSVAEHEIGHTLGLMHNFQGSFDALNYLDEYWDLRTDTIGVVVDGQRQLPVTAEQLLAANKQTQAQVDGRMDEYAYSSIMDYGSRMNSDIHGIGKYDEAAILFAYSGSGSPGYVETFTQTRAEILTDASGNQTTKPSSYNAGSTTRWPTSYTTTNQQGATVPYEITVRGAHTQFPLTQVTHYTPVTELITDRFHYTTLPLMFASAERNDLVDAVGEGVTRMRQRGFTKWSELEPLYKAIDASYRDFNASYQGALMSNAEEVSQVLDPVYKSYGVIPVEVPYMYCSDYEVGSNLTCNRWDRGADVYEMTTDWMTRYQQYYWFSNFKRDRYNWGPNNVFQRNYSRYMANFPNVYQHWVFNMFWNAFYGGWDYQSFDSAGVADVMYQNYWTMAVVDSTNLLLKTMSTPAAGYVAKQAGTSNWVHVPVAGNTHDFRLPAETESQLRADLLASGKYEDVAYLPRGEGRSMFTLYDHDGYDFFRRPVEVGHFWDQYAAMVAITSSETNFLGVDRGSDALRYSLPYYITFPKDLTKVFSGTWTGDTGAFSARITPSGDGLASTTLPATLNAKDYIAGFEYPVAQAPAGGDTVSPSPTWSTRFYAQLFGMAFFTENFNQEFAMQNQVFRVGTSEQLTPAQGYEVVWFADPFGGGYKYAALAPIAGSGVPNEGTEAAAPVMVRKAIAAKEAWDVAKAEADAAPSNAAKAAAAAEAEGRVREAVRSLEIMRGLYGVFSRTW